MVKLAVANQKGGVGKTTSCINIAAFLAVSGRKTLLVDLDPQSNATSGLGLVAKNRLTAYEVMLDPDTISDAIHTTRLSNLDIVPASINLVGCDIELASEQDRESRIKSALGKVKGYEFCLIDCPPSLGLLTLNALVAADYVIIPVQCEYYALEGLAKLLRTIELVKKRWNPSLKIAGFVFTMYDSRTNLSKDVVNEVKKHFDSLCFETLIPRNVRLSEAPSYGLPILLYDAKSTGAIAYKKLTSEVIKRCKKAD